MSGMGIRKSTYTRIIVVYSAMQYYELVWYLTDAVINTRSKNVDLILIRKSI